MLNSISSNLWPICFIYALTLVVRPKKHCQNDEIAKDFKDPKSRQRLIGFRNIFNTVKLIKVYIFFPLRVTWNYSECKHLFSFYNYSWLHYSYYKIDKTIRQLIRVQWPVHLPYHSCIKILGPLKSLKNSVKSDV